MNIDSVVQRVTVTRQNSVRIDDRELREFLRARGMNLPANARIFFAVPGGGDWSNIDIDISGENPICVEWTTEEQQHGQEAR